MFEVAKGSNTITTLASFNGTNGNLPAGSLVLDGQGNLYGTTEFGGAAGDGTVFELSGVTAVTPQATNLSAISGSGTYGGTATLTATLTASGSGVANEPVTFTFINGTIITPVGTATTNANGIATLTGVSLAGIGAGTYTGYVGASFAGDTNYSASSGSGNLTVAQAPLTITANNQSMVYGASVPVLTPSYAGFVNGDTPANLATPVVLSTNATSSSPVGTYAIQASGATAANYQITFVNGTLTINQASTTTTLAASINPSVYGQAVTFTATIYATSPGSGTPGGVVTFYDGTTVLDTETLNDGTATSTTSGIAVGSHSITVQYGGSTDFAGSASPSLTQTVSASMAYPDLVVSAIVNPASGEIDQPAKISWTDTNQGNADVTNGWDDQVFASPDGKLSDAILLGDFPEDGTLARGLVGQHHSERDAPRDGRDLFDHRGDQCQRRGR